MAIPIRLKKPNKKESQEKTNKNLDKYLLESTVPKLDIKRELKGTLVNGTVAVGCYSFIKYSDSFVLKTLSSIDSNIVSNLVSGSDVVLKMMSTMALISSSIGSGYYLVRTISKIIDNKIERFINSNPIKNKIKLKNDLVDLKVKAGYFLSVIGIGSGVGYHIYNKTMNIEPNIYGAFELGLFYLTVPQMIGGIPYLAKRAYEIYKNYKSGYYGKD